MNSDKHKQRNLENDQPSLLHLDVVRLDEKITNLTKETKELKEEFIKYVSRHEFIPVKLIVFGMAGTILTSALVLILSKVFVVA